MAFYEFNVAGVTMGNRQHVLRRISNAVRSICKTKSPDEYVFLLGRLQVRLKWEKDNPHDSYAVIIQVWSNRKRKWIGIGYVPRKIKLANGRALCVIVAKMLAKGMIDKVFIEDIGNFQRIIDNEEKIIYYCKVNITFQTG